MQRLTSLILPLALLLLAAPAFAQDESEMEEQQGNAVQEQVQDDMDSKQNRHDETGKENKGKKDKKEKKAKHNDDDDRNATTGSKRSDRADRGAERERMREVKKQCKQDGKEQKLRGQERKTYMRECMADTKE